MEQGCWKDQEFLEFRNGVVICTNINIFDSFCAIQLGHIPKILERGGALSEIKKGTVISSFVCLASTIAACMKYPNSYCYWELLQTEALCPLHLLPVPSNVLQVVLGYAFLSKATQKGNGIKEAACSHTVFSEKSHV